MLDPWLAFSVAAAAVGVVLWKQKLCLLLMPVAVVFSLMYSRHRHSYWAQRGIPTPPYIPFLGHFYQCFSPLKHRWQEYDKVQKIVSSS